MPSCEAKEIKFGIDLETVLDEPKLNDAVIGCSGFYDNEEKGVVFIKI
jgi:hypothetical protein